MIRDIRILGDPVLRKRADEVAAIDDEIRTLIDDMLQTMYDAEGVGLAAPQVGIGRRVIVVDVHEPDAPVLALINPRLIESSTDTDRGEEGCLSIPGLRDIVERPAHVIVEALDPAGEAVRIEADGLLARALQHEIDHLDGILFLDRVSPIKRSMLLKKWQKVKPEQAAK